MNTRNGPSSTPLEIVALRTTDIPTPKAKGRLIPATAMLRVFFPVRRRELRSNSKPTRNRKKRRPRFARVSNTVRL